PSMVVGEAGTKGGLWCSPVAKTSRPTSSALSAYFVIALSRSVSLGRRPVVGSTVTSPTLKIPNCIGLSSHSLLEPPQFGKTEFGEVAAQLPACKLLRIVTKY